MNYNNISIQHIVSFIEKNTKKIVIIGISIVVTQSMLFIPYVNVIVLQEIRWAIILITIFVVFKVRGVDMFKTAILLFSISLLLSFTNRSALRESIGNLTYIVLWCGVIREIHSFRKDTHLLQ